MTNWITGPPTQPGLYWYQLQGSAKIRSCEVLVMDEYPLNGMPLGALYYIGGPEGEAMRVQRPYRRWMSAAHQKPDADHTWTDPRFHKEGKK